MLVRLPMKSPHMARVALAWFIASCSLFLGQLPAQESAQKQRPNIVLIVADDLGWTDLSCRGSRFYETPNIDQLAADGITLTSFNVCQNCAPTRAALMSGQYAARTGVYTVGSFKRGKAKDRKMVPPENRRELPLEKVTLAESLQKAGYETAMFGKWHLGNDESHHPAARGFDQAIVSNGRHFKIRTNPEQDVPPETYLADYLSDKAVEFIEQPHEKPFFLYLPHFAVHTPIQAKEELIEKYREKPTVGGHKNPTYAAMIHSVDESVGRVRAALTARDLAENTVVIFMSDNGGLGGYRIPGTDKTKGITDNAPLHGGKGTLYEGGVRVPWIAAWPNHIPAGSESGQPAIHVDLYPTFLALAQQPAPEDYPLDGVSLLPLLLDPDQSFEHGPIYHHFPGYLESYIPEAIWRTTPVSTIRDGDYKLMEFFEDGRVELYNLQDDLSETNNLIDDQPETANRLHDQLKRWRKELNVLMPEAKPTPQQ